jgi:hypothetical protein
MVLHLLYVAFLSAGHFRNSKISASPAHQTARAAVLAALAREHSRSYRLDRFFTFHRECFLCDNFETSALRGGARAVCEVKHA